MTFGMNYNYGHFRVKWIKSHLIMSSLPPCIFFINGDISLPPQPPPNPPDLDVFIGSQPQLPQSYASFSELTNLQTQLFINDTMTKVEFDARVQADPNYPIVVHLRGLRILVILPTFYDHHNRHWADVVIFLHQGMADVECNRLAWPGLGRPSCETFPCPTPPPPDYPHEHPHRGIAVGPPGQSYDIQRLTIYELLRAAGSHNVVILPFEMMPHCGECNFGFYCDSCHTFSGIRKCFGCGCSCKCGCDVQLIDNQGVRSSPVHLPNCDREMNNPAFIHRK